jgi:hypothetical protein
MEDLVKKLLAEALERANKAPSVSTEPVVEAVKEPEEEKVPSPVVSLVYQTSKAPVTTGIPAGIKVTLETYDRAYTKKLMDLGEFEQSLRAEFPNLTNEQVETQIDKYVFDRMCELDALKAIIQLEYVVSWRVQEERLRISSDARREAVRKADRAYRSVATDGTPRKTREKKEPAARVPTNPEEKREMAIKLMMNRLGFTREAAEERMSMMESLKAPEPRPNE